jgi:integrase
MSPCPAARGPLTGRQTGGYQETSFEGAAAKAGIRLKGWHTLRHTYSTLLKANGNDPRLFRNYCDTLSWQPPCTDILRHSRPISTELTVE